MFEIMFIVKKGFTLAEVLITLLMVGVIASIVIPGLIQDSQKAELKSALKKVYSDLNQATMMIKQDNGGTLQGIFLDNSTFHSGTTSLSAIYGKYINIIRTCGSSGSNISAPNPCWHLNNQWYGESGNPTSGCDGCITFYTNSGYWVTGDGGGAIIPGCNYTDASSGIKDACVFGIYVDINGVKKPNKINSDIFWFYLDKNLLKPYKKTADFMNQ